MANPSLSKGEFLLPDCLQTGTLAFSYLHSLKHLLFLGLSLLAFGSELHHQLSWVFRLLTCPANLGTCHPHWSREPISFNNPSYWYVYILLVLFLWKTLTSATPTSTSIIYSFLNLCNFTQEAFPILSDQLWKHPRYSVLHSEFSTS